MTGSDNVFQGCRSLLIQIPIAIGQQILNIGFQSSLQNSNGSGKNIRAVFTSGQTVGRNNVAVINTNFYVELWANNTLVHQFSAILLQWANDKLVIIDRPDIDWDKSQIILPAASGVATSVELIVIYDDVDFNRNVPARY